MAEYTTENCLRFFLWILYCSKIVTGNGGCIQIPHDCLEVRDMGFTTSGVYHVTPLGVYKGFDVYCDMETDDGGWLVFQRRMDGSVDFFRGWEDYQFGFGNLTGEHWLGNFPLFIITSQGHHELRVDLEDWEGNTRFAKYRIFNIGHPAELYNLTTLGYTGDAGDSMGVHNGQSFSTKDSDNDAADVKHCADEYMGGWWYEYCHRANLNGIYREGNYTGRFNGIDWKRWKGYNYSLKRVEMKTRRIHFDQTKGATA